jgi:hypothetical protein
MSSGLMQLVCGQSEVEVKRLAEERDALVIEAQKFREELDR